MMRLRMQLALESDMTCIQFVITDYAVEGVDNIELDNARA